MDFDRLRSHGSVAAVDVIQQPSISAKICSLLKCAPVIAPAGQAATQVPQPLHSAGLTSADPLVLVGSRWR